MNYDIDDYAEHTSSLANKIYVRRSFAYRNIKGLKNIDKERYFFVRNYGHENVSAKGKSLVMTQQKIGRKT